MEVLLVRPLGSPSGAYFTMSSAILGSMPVVDVSDCVIAVLRLIVLSL